MFAAARIAVTEGFDPTPSCWRAFYLGAAGVEIPESNAAGPLLVLVTWAATGVCTTGFCTTAGCACASLLAACA